MPGLEPNTTTKGAPPMKARFLVFLALSITGLSAGTAFAAPADAPTQSGPSHWAGWYAGVDAGYNRTDDAWTDKNYFDNDSTTDHINGGGSAGLVGGYNWVKSNGLFYGAEADINYMSNSGDTTHCPGGSCGDASIQRTAWSGYGTVRGRIGIAFDPALVFLTAGLAAADIKDEWRAMANNSNQPNIQGFSKSGISVGGVLGAGTEFAVADHVSVSLQYLYLQMLQRTADLVCTGCNPVHNGYQLDDSASILRVGVNYKFQ